MVSVTSNVLISKKFEAFVAIENLLDTQFEEVFGYQSSGRTARLGLKLRIE